jgi:hypothetical protein
MCACALALDGAAALGVVLRLRGAAEAHVEGELAEATDGLLVGPLVHGTLLEQLRAGDRDIQGARRLGSGGRTRTYDTRIMIPLL